MTREYAKNQLETSIDLAMNNQLSTVTFFQTDLITGEVNCYTSYFNNNVELQDYMYKKLAKLKSLLVPYCCYVDGSLYSSSGDMLFDDSKSNL